MDNYIGLCGNIASGKSTVASILERSNMNVIFEDFEKHICLDDFYNNPEGFSFETELNFLLQHYYFIKKVLKKSSSNLFDFSITLDRAYADVTLSSNRKKLFHMVADELEEEIGLPSKIIFICCPEEILIDRIKKRNREFEKSITIDYLSALTRSIENQIALISKKTNVIKINSHEIDFLTDINNQKTIQSLILDK